MTGFVSGVQLTLLRLLLILLHVELEYSLSFSCLYIFMIVVFGCAKATIDCIGLLPMW